MDVLVHLGEDLGNLSLRRLNVARMDLISRLASLASLPQVRRGDVFFLTLPLKPALPAGLLAKFFEDARNRLAFLGI